MLYILFDSFILGYKNIILYFCSLKCIFLDSRIMDLRKYLLICTFVAFGCVGNLFAQSSDSTKQSIIEHIKEGERHVLVMPDSVAKLLLPTDGGDLSKENRQMRVFWRVQVFSDSKGERSRQEGLRKRSAVARRFPDYPIELKWDSPYWQLRVGKFTEREEADEAVKEIKKAFPSYSKEIHVVRQRMKVED